jgi:hypothetical protein
MAAKHIGSTDSASKMRSEREKNKTNKSRTDRIKTRTDAKLSIAPNLAEIAAFEETSTARGDFENEDKTQRCSSTETR